MRFLLGRIRQERNTFILIVFGVFVLSENTLANVIQPNPTEAPICNNPKVLIVSFDGFRYDYLDKVPTPNFDRVRNGGVKAKWIKNAYVTKTFPNHYSIVSGLYEESSGIINNDMYDPVWNRTFLPHEMAKNCDWFGGEPIWVTNQIHGHHHKSGSYFWIGSDCDDPIKGVHPTYYEHYNQTIPFKQRADTVVDWFTMKGINLGLLYYHEPDHTGHQWGPDSPQMENMIKECDTFMGYLLDQLEKYNLIDKINLIVTSDHGMAGYGENQTVYLDDYISPNLYSTTDGTPFKNIWPLEGQKENVYKKLKAVPHLNVFYKEDIPGKFHYKNNRRVAPIFTMADLGWLVVPNRESWREKGDHGWSNDLSVMHPFFLAKGPAFKENLISEPFNNVDIYPLMCHLLGVEPAPNNGSFANVKHLLKKKDDNHIVSARELAVTISTYVFAFIVVGGIGSLIIIGAFLQCRRKPVHIIKINPLKPMSRNHLEATGLLQDSDEDGS